MMSPSDLMDQLVYELMARYEADVLPSGLLYLELWMKGHCLLVIEEKIKHRQMRVCYLLFDHEGNPVPEPELWFYIDPYGHWVPYELQRHTAGHHAFADLDVASGKPIVIDARHQEALAVFADFWAEILRAQGWLEFADKVSNQSASSLEDDPSQPPDVETLWDWVDEYGKCTATDGCWCEPDGCCEHGHKSWLVELGLI